MELCCLYLSIMEKIVDFPDAEICIALLCGIANGEEVKAKLIDGSLSATLLNCRHVGIIIFLSCHRTCIYYIIIMILH